jgi:hypothetical protein
MGKTELLAAIRAAIEGAHESAERVAQSVPAWLGQ